MLIYVGFMGFYKKTLERDGRMASRFEEHIILNRGVQCLQQNNSSMNIANETNTITFAGICKIFALNALFVIVIKNQLIIALHIYILFCCLIENYSYLHKQSNFFTRVKIGFQNWLDLKIYL